MTPPSADVSTQSGPLRSERPTGARQVGVAAGVGTFLALGAAGFALDMVAAELQPTAAEPGSAAHLVLLGGLAFLAAYNGLASVTTRQVSYALYGLLGAALTVVYGTYFDLPAELLGVAARPERRALLNHIASGWALALSLGFALAFLGVHRHRPRLTAALTGFAIGLGLFSAAVVPLLDPRAAELALAISGALIAPTLVALGVDAWRRGFRAARYYLAAWVPLIFAGGYEAFVVFAVAPPMDGLVLMGANLLEMLVLALALVVRVKLAVEARELAHTEEVRALETELETARRLGPYTLGDKIGQGGMGAVYEASHALLRRPTAVKLILPGAAGAGAMQRFEREVHTMSRLTHPNTVTVFDYGRTEDGTLYYAMEFLDGATISEIVAVGGPQPPSRVAHVMAMVAAALGEAHQTGLIHRDIKPSNIFLASLGGERDVAKVLDFGLVKDLEEDARDPEITEEGALAGTPYYMAPELLADPPTIEPRSDLYALGAVAYLMLTGEQPFGGGNVFQVMLRHMREAPPPPSERVDADIPADLEAVIVSLLERDFQDRPANAAALQASVEACACFGEWTAEDADAWWAEYEAPLRERRRSRLESASERPLPNQGVMRGA